MVLSVPKYIQEANIQDVSIRYQWDDWNEEQAEEKFDEKLASRLKDISQRAVLAFMCGSAEWVVYRLANLHDNPAPADYLEASWAMLVNVRYSGYGGTWWQNFAINGWGGPIKRPVAKALEDLEIAIQQLDWEGTDPVDSAVLLSSLTSYVMTDPAPYNRWCEQIMDRLESLYPKNPEDELGDVVPRQAIDPEFDFKIEQTESLINKFLASLDYRKNIFLSTPDEMIEIYDDEDKGFRGEPYVYDIKADRNSRREEP